MKAYFFLIFSAVFLLDACLPSSEKPYNSKATIRYDINNITGLKLDTSKFVVLMDSIHHTEGAFDSDYTWYVKIKFGNEYFDSLKCNIRNTSYYNAVKGYGSNGWKGVDTSKVKGVWYARDTAKIEFIKKPNYFDPEPIYLNVDTVNKILNLTLMHL